ncbi:MAG TPA: FtsQ-type POTRA domain-containing protein [Candidatus Limnocylindrales bacterium]|nr:FtsQ-type POTRA domain-containing protein [Candidatus Limnocylindrales bacterium]
MKRNSNHLKLAPQRSGASARARIKRLIIRLIAFSILLVTVIGVEALFRVSEIQVVGANALNKQTIVSSSGLETGMSIFLFRSQQVADRIRQEYPRVKEITVSRKFPDAIVITLTERIVAGFITTEDGFWIIDRDIISFDHTAELFGSYPIISGISTEQVSQGAPLSCSARRNILKSFFEAWPDTFQIELAELSLRDSYNLVVYTACGLEIWLGNEEDMKHKLMLVKQSIPHLPPGEKTRIDVRAGGRLIVAAVINTHGNGVNP